MPNFQPKKGICIDCGSETEEKPLIAKRCHFHYWKHRNAINTQKRKVTGVSETAFENRRELDEWFMYQMSNLPPACENCGEPLNKFAPWAAKAYVAHIVPKRNFHSVRTHPINRVFLCIQCHANYDNWGGNKIMKMAVFGLIVERFELMYDKIAADELRHLPFYLANVCP